ncbi:hypothetical protein BJX99DRAFT_267116 [Aspergillus californicus]
MHLHSLFHQALRYGLLTSFLLSSSVTATRLIEANSLDIPDSTNFSAASFGAQLYPDNQTIAFALSGVTTIEGYVTADVEIVIYGYHVQTDPVNPCSIDGIGFCPMHAGDLQLDTTFEVPNSTFGHIPGIGFEIPDLDASIQITVRSRDTGARITFIEAVISNGKTVYQAGVGWTTAVIAGLALLLSVFVSIRSTPAAAAELAGYTLSLFSFMQAQAMIGMLAVPLPPIVRSWTQNFQWCMGVVHAAFLQRICTWYQRSTGGTAATLLSELSTSMVHLSKRGLARRAESQSSTDYFIRGLERVAFRASINDTNLFLTSMILFGFVVFVVAVLLLLWKVTLIVLERRGKRAFSTTARAEWTLVAKGIFYRLYLLAFAPISVFCLWELTKRDSPAEIVVAVLTFLSVVGALAWAALQIFLTKQPHILFSDKTCLHKYGFLYLQYNPATALYFPAIVLVQTLLKTLFVSFAQSSPNTQAVAFLILETSMLLTVSILRPWRDRRSKGFNITIAALNFANALFVLFFSGVFGQPTIVSSVMGIVLFIACAALTLILLLLVIWIAVRVLLRRESDGPYVPMRDSLGNLGSRELDVLAGEREVKSGFWR